MVLEVGVFSVLAQSPSGEGKVGGAGREVKRGKSVVSFGFGRERQRKALFGRFRLEVLLFRLSGLKRKRFSF